jgi:hypothetical protein
MEYKDIRNYEDLENFLRHFSLWEGYQYDPNGIIHLLGALVDNLTEHVLDAELEDVRCLLSLEQIAFLKKMMFYIDNLDEKECE